MSTLIFGGTGFIGSHLATVLADQGEEVICFDINPGTASFADYASGIRIRRGDITRFEDVLAATLTSKPSRVVNLAYIVSAYHPTHAAFKLNVLGMANVFECARLCDIQRVVFGSSLAVS